MGGGPWAELGSCHQDPSRMPSAGPGLPLHPSPESPCLASTWALTCFRDLSLEKGTCWEDTPGEGGRQAWGVRGGQPWGQQLLGTPSRGSPGQPRARPAGCGERPGEVGGEGQVPATRRCLRANEPPEAQWGPATFPGPQVHIPGLCARAVHATQDPGCRAKCPWEGGVKQWFAGFGHWNHLELLFPNTAVRCSWPCRGCSVSSGA